MTTTNRRQDERRRCAPRARRSDSLSLGVIVLSAVIAALAASFLRFPPAPQTGSTRVLGVAEAAALRGMAVAVVLRHAEKANGENPPLSEAGRTRARALAELLDEVPIRRLIASDLRRTQETLAPLARKKDVQIERTPSRPAAQAAARVAAKLKELRAGEFAVVAHHSFTIAAILGEFGWKIAAPRDHDDVWLLFLEDGEAVGHVALRVPAAESTSR